MEESVWKALINRALEQKDLLVLAHKLADILDGADLRREVEYLVDHGYLKAGFNSFEGTVIWVQVTAAGRDYVREDGGITSIKNVITVRLHEDTIRALLISRVQTSDADDTVKGKLVDQIKALPSEAVSKLAEKALEKALQQMPFLVQWLQTQPWN